MFLLHHRQSATLQDNSNDRHQWRIQTFRKGDGHPDPEITGGRSQETIFSALWASFWCKSKKGAGSPGALPLIHLWALRDTRALFVTLTS